MNGRLVPTRRFYGWWIVAGLFMVQLVSSGFGFYNLSVYMHAIVGARGFAVADVSLAVSVFFVAGGMSGVWLARLIDRVDIRFVMIAGAAIGALGLMLSGFARSLWQLYVLYAVFGFGNAGVGVVVATTLVTRWFPGRNRSIALSIASTGLSVGGIVITPLSAILIERIGFDAAMPWMGLGFFLLITPVALFIVKGAPGAVEHGVGTTETPAWSFASAVRSRFYVLLTAGFVMCMGAQVGGISHLYNHGDHIAGYLVAATCVQALTVMSISGRLLGGWLAARVPLQPFVRGNTLLQASGLLVLAGADTPWQLLVGSGIFGASVGNLLMLHPLLIADAFGVRVYARLFSWSSVFTMSGVASGPYVLGAFHDALGYSWAYTIGAGMTLCGFVLLTAAGRRPNLPDPTRSET